MTWILHQKPGIVLDHPSKVRRRLKRERSIQHDTRRLSEDHDREAPTKVKFSSAMIKLLASWAKKMAGKLTDDLTDPKFSASLASEFQRHVKRDQNRTDDKKRMMSASNSSVLDILCCELRL